MFSPAPAFCFYHQLEWYRKKTRFPLRESGTVCGPTQRLPAAVLSGLGKALTSKSIKHVFPLGGAPFFGSVPILVRHALTAVPSVQVHSLQWSPWVCSWRRGLTRPPFAWRRNGRLLLQLPSGLPYRETWVLPEVYRLCWEGYLSYPYVMSLYSFKWAMVAHFPSYQVAAHLHSPTGLPHWPSGLANQLPVKPPLCVPIAGRGAAPSLETCVHLQRLFCWPK